MRCDGLPKTQYALKQRPGVDARDKRGHDGTLLTPRRRNVWVAPDLFFSPTAARMTANKPLGGFMRDFTRGAALAAALFFSPLAQAAPTAVFPAVFVNSSPQATTPEEVERVKTMDEALKKALVDSGQYQPVDLTPVASDFAAVRDIHDCNGCEIDLAKKAGAKFAVVAWTQKVSNLILNLNIRISDVETGQVVKGGSVDIRGNNDLAWTRGLKYLLEEYVFRAPR
jgi:hypothetical protein